MRVAVVGHVEWVEFVRVPRLPGPGEIVHAEHAFAEPAGGGPVAARQLALLAGACGLYTVLGDDELGRRSAARMRELGIEVHAVYRDRTRRAITHTDASGERTITVLGDRLEPRGADPLPWDALGACDAVYFCSGDAAAARAARGARVMVATSRTLPTLRGVALDAIAGSATDPSERYADGDLDPPPRLAVRTEGAAGGTVNGARYRAAALPGEPGDAYGCGDSFVAALTYGLAAGMGDDEAIALAARCGAAARCGRGPYEGQTA